MSSTNFLEPAIEQAYMRAMNSRILSIAVLMSATGAQAQADDRHIVADNNNWSIMDSDCSIDAEWDDGKGIVVSLHEGHYDLELYYPKFKAVIADKVIPAKISAGEHFGEARTYDVLGFSSKETRAYTAAIEDDLLDRIAESQILQFYRGDIMLADLNMEGFREAYWQLKSCEAGMAAAAPADDATGSDGFAESAALEAAADAMAAAADDMAAGVDPAMEPK